MSQAREPSLCEARRYAAKRLEAAGSSTAALDARVLLAYCLDVSPEDFFRMQDDPLPAAAARRFEALITRREQGEPVAFLTGRQEFWNHVLAVTPGTLIPRADSETLIETVLEARPDREAPLRILDLGTGSGCLLLALLSEFPAAWGIGVDCSIQALEVAAANATYTGLEARAAFVNGRWGGALGQPFDVVIANPPYIRRDDIPTLQPEVHAFEPVTALDGGVDGLESIRAILGQLHGLLVSKGVAVMEFGWDQADAVAELVKKTRGLAPPEFRLDLGHHRRCVVLRRACEA